MTVISQTVEEEQSSELMAAFPTVFVSHGMPDLPVGPSPARDFFVQLGPQLGRPEAILVISAHWNTGAPTVSGALRPSAMHDFGGFPAELYSLGYRPPGAPALADRVVDLLDAGGVKSAIDSSRGLDHGAWVPLLLMYPEANIPVTQLSIHPSRGPAHHLAVGRALEPLAREGVLVLASGSATHNLREIYNCSPPRNALPPVWVSKFSEWLTETVQQGNVNDLLNYRHLAPHAIDNHPSEEHLLPLFVALGASGAGGKKGHLLHSSFSYGLLSMAAYLFPLGVS